MNPLIGEMEYWTDVTISSTRFSYTSIQNYTKTSGGRGVADPLIFPENDRRKHLTRSQLGLGPIGEEQILDVEGLPEEKRMDRIIDHFNIVIDPHPGGIPDRGRNGVPMDGSDPKEIQMDEALLPFYAEAMDYQDTQGNPGYYLSSMEELCEKLGADYSWDPETKTATGGLPRRDPAADRRVRNCGDRRDACPNPGVHPQLSGHPKREHHRRLPLYL